MVAEDRVGAETEAEADARASRGARRRFLGSTAQADRAALALPSTSAGGRSAEAG
jgi:hypothetical protein